MTWTQDLFKNLIGKNSFSKSLSCDIQHKILFSSIDIYKFFFH
jgi:hypothetical protein